MTIRNVPQFVKKIFSMSTNRKSICVLLTIVPNWSPTPTTFETLQGNTVIIEIEPVITF